MSREERRTGYADQLLLSSGDQVGTAPEDRAFRPDIEGLRAVAVVLVVLFHAGVPGVTGGYVGVDIFFVISGFVITGVLLRERGRSGHNSILDFYGRRSRRIIPAATVVIIATVLASYHWLGFITGGNVAQDGRAAATFWVNLHFITTGTNYLGSQLPPSPLQNFWSLSVEEQFYVLYPALFLSVGALTLRHLSFNSRMSIALGLAIASSFWWSVVSTSSNATGAYFSPFPRAWELALGAIVAINTHYFVKLPSKLCAIATWLGLIGIFISAFGYSPTTMYPGSAVALPVLSTGLVIAGGTSGYLAGAELFLRIPPFQWIGKVSYSLYLWHWPLLIIPMEFAGHPLSLKDNLGWVGVALVASMASLLLIENPIRHAVRLRKSWILSIALGFIFTATSVSVATYEITSHP
ncbi:MAG TPA: acyltransferase [Acidimicrobiales bacterium]|jgi:peptidoglycan/LPS O-acetylase OafA/YrhL|nr:acyltransferase [Acidimicrobiales bacterium]